MIGTLRTFTNMVYSIGKERFGTKKGKLGIEQKDQTYYKQAGMKDQRISTRTKGTEQTV